jgi:hypothetical protein
LTDIPKDELKKLVKEVIDEHRNSRLAKWKSDPIKVDNVFGIMIMILAISIFVNAMLISVISLQPSINDNEKKLDNIILKQMSCDQLKNILSQTDSSLLSDGFTEHELEKQITARC